MLGATAGKGKGVGLSEEEARFKSTRILVKQAEQ